MRTDDQRPEPRPGEQRARIPRPPMAWNDEEQESPPASPPASRRDREQLMRELRYGNATGLPAAPGKPVAPRRSGIRPGQVIGLLLLGALCVAVGFFYSKLKNISGKKGIPSIIGGFTNPRQSFPGKDRVTILLIGKDYDRFISKTNRSLNGQPTSKESRSDSIILASLDLENKKVSLLSIPRDTYVYNLDGEAGKINATYRLGGQQRLRRTVEKLIGVAPDYFVAVRIPGVSSIVDALGGVDIETIDAMEYIDYWGGLYVNLPKGKQRINGEQAIGFARYRHADLYERNPDHSPIHTGTNSDGTPRFRMKRHIAHSLEEGDPRRMKRQQDLIRAILTRAKSLDNLLQVDKIINVGLDQIETDMERDQIFALAALFRTIQPDSIQSGTLPGEGGKRGSYWYFRHDPEKSKLMVDWLVNGNEKASYELTTVEVQNGTKVPGAARSVVNHLREVGFSARNGGNVKRSADAEEPSQTRIIFHTAPVLPRAKRVAELLGGGTIVKEPLPDTAGAMDERDLHPDITVILGQDLAGQATHKDVSR